MARFAPVGIGRVSLTAVCHPRNGTDLVTPETIDDDLDTQQSVVLVLDLEKAKSGRHQIGLVRFQRFSPR